MLLAIDTATRLMSLALHDGAALIAEQSWHTNNQHTTQLAPAIQAMLAVCDVSVNDLTALAASTGPGSYTGLRIGVALAKGLAAAHQLPLVGVSSMDTLAAGQPYMQTAGGLITVVQAGRGRILVKTYRWRRGRWNSHAEAQIMDWEKLIANIDGAAYITGEINEEGIEALTSAQQHNIPVTIAPPAQRLRRAGFLAEVAWERLREVEDRSVFDSSALLPVYIKTENLS